MRNLWIRVAVFFFAISTAVIANAQTDVAASLYGAFSNSANANGTVQSPSLSAGGLLELRHIRNPLVGYEATYSYNRANQTYNSNCTSGCSTILPTTRVLANANEVTADWVVSLHVLNVRPFALAGGGVLFDSPVSGQAGTTSSTKAVFVYGGGVDVTMLPHLGLRFQYRGNLNKAPDMATAFTSTNAFVHTAEPMIGIFFRL